MNFEDKILKEERFVITLDTCENGFQPQMRILFIYTINLHNRFLIKNLYE